MLKENDKLTDALIQIIQSLPETKRKKIADKITSKKRKSKPVRKKQAAVSSQKKKMEEFSNYLDSLGSRLPKDYKFDREEANER